jgi:type I restriction enzyme, S subunit
MSKFEFIKAEKLYKNITDGTHDSPKTQTTGFPLVTSKNIKGGVLDLGTANFITKEDFESINKRSKVDQWDVIISMIGEYCGYTYIESNVSVKYAVKNVGLFKTGSFLEARWLTYYLKSDYGKHFLKQSKSGSSQPYIALGALRNLLILNPPKLIKENIVNVLSCLDIKIELNNRINAELEQMAKTIYDYWFVQFDFPISAEYAASVGQPELEGKPYKSSGGKMVWSDELKREVPEGWEVKKLEEVERNIITGKTPSTSNDKYFNGNIPFICIGDVRGNMHIVKTEISLTDEGAESQNNKFIPKGAICVTCIASPGLVGFATTDSQTNQQLNSVVCKYEENRYYLYFYLIDYFKFSQAKTGNTFANMNKGDFSDIKVIKPSNAILLNFKSKLDSAIEKILNNSLENQKLTELRDWLLPMLMNGQVKVVENVDEDIIGMAAEPLGEYKKFNKKL